MYAPDLFSNPTARVIIPVVMRLSCFPYGYRGVFLVMTSMVACCLATTALSMCNFAIVTTIWADDTIQSCSVGLAQSLSSNYSNSSSSVTTSCPCAYGEVAYDGAMDATWIFGLSMGLIAVGIGWICWIAVLIACCCRRLTIRPWVFGSIYSFLGATSFLMLVGFASKPVCGNIRHASSSPHQTALTTSLRLCTFGPGAGMAIGAGLLYLLSSMISFFLRDEPTAATATTRGGDADEEYAVKGGCKDVDPDTNNNVKLNV